MDQISCSLLHFDLLDPCEYSLLATQAEVSANVST